ncbi:MBL fold metallo-hydrolase [Corynebacterium pseudodiphtheriticum]|uniref:MBL fold metallo-hydrolase n=1 Tax=Corynebacterium pseudodiphtheriticum TaxID=37637 RepID=UPI00254D469C|nr:MBL fold metallo-hydrolase [Corynebacterium pseudodiphtheriticum]MDK8546291.1 MBL fold metallo-hydrolase [Corynebacterium pseudodiphtheriticum]
MKLTVLGSSGSVPSPGNPASGYLLTFSDSSAPSVVVDFGSGVFAALQEIAEPSACHLVISHMHADHCSDFPGLMVWRRFHPTRNAHRRHRLLGPSHTVTHLGRMSGNFLDEVDDLSDTFEFTALQHGVPQVFEQATITPFRTVHPTETFALRIEDHVSGKVIAYSADTAYTEDLVECARDAEYFLCEAAWGVTAADKISGMHMSGADAGVLASKAGVRNLVLTHLQPWGDSATTVRAAENHFSGRVQVALPGNEYTV